MLVKMVMTRRGLVYHQERPRRHRLCRHFRSNRAHPPDRGRGLRSWAWKSTRSSWPTHVGDTVQITDGPLTSFTGTVEMRWTSTTTRCAWSCPCSAARRPSSWSSIRWRSFPSNASIDPRSERGRGVVPRQKYAQAHITTFYSGGALSWHRKSQVISNCRSTPLRRPHPPRSARLWVSTASISPQFIKEFNERTKDQVGFKIPVVITVYADRSFTFITKTPPTPTLIMKAIGRGEGLRRSQQEQGWHHHQGAGRARSPRRKMPDLNAATHRGCDEPGCRHLPLHGHYRRRLIIASDRGNRQADLINVGGLFRITTIRRILHCLEVKSIRRARS